MKLMEEEDSTRKEMETQQILSDTINSFESFG